jgi:hypothetical protein
VGVAVDQPREQGVAGQVEDLGPLGRRLAGAEQPLDPLPSDQQPSSLEDSPGLDVDQPRSPDRQQPTVPIAHALASSVRAFLTPMMTDADFPLDRTIRRIRRRGHVMSPRTPRHLAEHRLPWRLLLVAFGLTFAVLAALVASAALVPKAPPAPSAVQQLPAETTSPPYPTDPPSVSPSSAGPGSSSSTSTSVPQQPPPGVSSVAQAAQTPPSAAPRATTPATTPGTTGPPATPAPPPPSLAPTTTELPPALVSSVAPTATVEPTTTTAEPTTTTVEATTVTAGLALTSTAGATTTTAQLLVTTTQPPTAGVLLAPLLGLLYLLRAHLPAPGRHARPGGYRLPQVRSRRATRRPPRRARTRP